jgi:predicted dithiol-disulfide oxidoreductase (DUF899 family)
MTTSAQSFPLPIAPTAPAPIEYPQLHVVSPAEWREARIRHLAREKELTRARDVLNEERRALPVVAVEKDYRFETSTGSARLIDLFEGRRQLIVYHFMFFREKGEGCPGCSHLADNVPHLSHMHARETTFALVSRAPLAELEPFKRRMGWKLPWHSSYGSDFNYDFHATTDETVRPVEYNYRTKEELEARGQSYHVNGEQHGVSVFLRDSDRVYHTYSTYGRGPDSMLATYSWLDITPFGRGEGWDGMPDLKVPLRHHDRYDD